jgi:hypothetical protein
MDGIENENDKLGEGEAVVEGRGGVHVKGQ